jgi:hypothetical protein
VAARVGGRIAEQIDDLVGGADARGADRVWAGERDVAQDEVGDRQIVAEIVGDHRAEVGLGVVALAGDDAALAHVVEDAVGRDAAHDRGAGGVALEERGDVGPARIGEHVEAGELLDRAGGDVDQRRLLGIERVAGVPAAGGEHDQQAPRRARGGRGGQGAARTAQRDRGEARRAGAEEEVATLHQ